MNDSMSDRPVIVAEYFCPIEDAKFIREKIESALTREGSIVWQDEGSTENEFILRRVERVSPVAITPFPPGKVPRLEGARAGVLLTPSAQERREEIFKIWLKKSREGHIIEVEYFPVPYHIFRRGTELFDIKLLVDMACDPLNAIFVKTLGSEEIDPYAVSKPYKEPPETR